MRPQEDKTGPQPQRTESSTTARSAETKGDKKSRAKSLTELVVIVLVAIGLAIALQAWVVKPYGIPSGSMEPTLKVGQRVLVNRIGTHFSNPHIGEITVFHPPFGASQQQCGPVPHTVKLGAAACSEPIPKEDTGTNFIKRIVAGPGDVISIREGHVIRNGSREKDFYIRSCEGSAECDFPIPIRIPAGHWFMMGDNRGASDDSRFWGPVPTSWIIGEAFATYWPLDRVGFL